MKVNILPSLSGMEPNTTKIIGLVGVAIVLCLLAWRLAKKIMPSHGKDGHGGGYGLLGTFALMLGILLGLAILAGTVRVLMASDFHGQVFGRSAMPVLEGEIAINRYGSSRIEVTPGMNIFTLTSTNQSVRVDFPLYLHMSTIFKSGKAYVRGENLAQRLSPANDTSSLGTNKWLEYTSAEAWPVEVQIIVTRQYN